MSHYLAKVGLGAALVLSVAACGDDGSPSTDGDATGDGGSDVSFEDCDTILEPGETDQTTVQEALILAEPGSTVCLAAGTYSFTGELSIDVDDLTLRGAGMELTVLDFSGQEVGSGGNGIKGSSDGLTFEDLQVRDTPGDGIRVDDANDVTFRRVHVRWTAEQSQDNGAYGLYPVGCSGVLVEDSIVNGARDAGIYVGQSNDILVQNNEVFGNVAGLEIENSNDAEVRGNHAHDNTAGILVFNLPGLAQYGSATLVHDNLVENNNLPNFGVQGTVVAAVPGGSGLVVLACDDNEFRDNVVRGNQTLGIVVFTYLSGLFGGYDDDLFDPSPQGNWIHDNTFENNGTDPIGTLHAVIPDGVIPEPSPDIVFDGCAEVVDEGNPVNCVQETDATFINLDFCGSFENPSTDASAFDCANTPLEERP